MTTIALIFSFLWWAATLIFAVWWAERRYVDGYHAGYQDACRWIEEPTGSVQVYGYFGDEP